MRHISSREKLLTSVAAFTFATLLSLSFFTRAHAVEASEPDNSLSGTFHYMLVGVAQSEGVSYASLIDRRNGFHYLLTTKSKSDLDVQLSSVQTELDPLGPSVILRKGDQFALLKTEPITALNSELGAPAELSSPLSPVITRPNTPPPLASIISQLKPPVGGTLPLVFQEVDPKKMTLTDEQKTTLNQLRQAFLDDINGTTSGATTASGNQTDNTAPATSTNATPDQQLQKWQAAQDRSDEQFRMLYGNQAFNAYTESSSYPTPP